MEIITDYSVHRQYILPIEEYTIVRYPVCEQVQGEDGTVLGYRQMTNDEIDREIMVYSEKDGFITLADFKKKYILSLS